MVFGGILIASYLAITNTDRTAEMVKCRKSAPKALPNGDCKNDKMNISELAQNVTLISKIVDSGGQVARFNKKFAKLGI